MDATAEVRLAEALKEVSVVVCESQYRDADAELARRNFHMTAAQTASLAKRAKVGKLVLFHFSDRYRLLGWSDMLAEAQAIFPATTLPSHWAES
jgi:ribonuclease Z